MKQFIGFREKDALSWMAAFERGEAPTLHGLPLEMYKRFFDTDAPQPKWLAQHGYTPQQWGEAYERSSSRVNAWLEHLERRRTRIQKMLAYLEHSNSSRTDLREKCALLLDKAELQIEIFAGLFHILPELLERQSDDAICAPRWSPTAHLPQQPFSISFSLDELLGLPAETFGVFSENLYEWVASAVAAVETLERYVHDVERSIRVSLFGIPALRASFNEPPPPPPLTFCPQLQSNAPSAL